MGWCLPLRQQKHLWFSLNVNEVNMCLVLQVTFSVKNNENKPTILCCGFLNVTVKKLNHALITTSIALQEP